MVEGGDLEFWVLGPVEVSDSGRNLPLGGPKQRALLADLILNAGTIVSTAQLIDDLWGDTSPTTAGHTVETYIARLRRVLRDGSRPEVLLTRPPGYLLDVEPGHVDAFRFGQLVKGGAAAAGRGDHGEASALLRAGLALWRGPALADVADAPFARAAARRLTDQHLLALERRIDSDLQLGRAQDLIPELEALVVSHPYHELFHRQLMLALYRSGRQSDALGAFRRARGLLVDELGIEPGPDLRRMEQAILRQDPGLEQPPAGNFLYKLAFAFTAPVPASMPAHEAGTSPVPATGPYMITRYLPEREIHLARNPYFRQWSAAAQPDGFPDRIVWRFGLTPAQEVAAIEAGRADWMADPPPDYQDLAGRYNSQVHINPLPGISYAAFNVTVPPFNDPRVRQAVSLAADRNQAVSALGGPGAAQPTCQIIPPGLPGYRPYCPFTTDPSASGAWVGPDLARARRLVAASHTEGMPVVVWAHQWDGPLGPYLVAVLHELGYRASLRVASVAAFARNVNDTRRRAQASVGTWIADYPSASDFFDLFFRCSSFRPADPADTRSGSFFCHPGIDRQMSQADQLQVSDPQAAAQVWAKVDREITDLAAWVPLLSLRFADFTSARVGDYQYNPVWGILLDQLWVR
jgi:DNA-binding SARP family transcriptional activator